MRTPETTGCRRGTGTTSCLAMYWSLASIARLEDSRQILVDSRDLRLEAK